MFADGEDWGDVLMETHPRRIGRRADAEVARRKAAGGSTMPDWVISELVAAELTLMTGSPEAASGQAEQVLAWAKSVAQHRFMDGRNRDPQR